MLNAITRFICDEEGAIAIEYGLIAGLISVVILVALTDIGTNLKAIFEKIKDNLVVPT